MASQLQPVRGTHDLLPDSYIQHHRVIEAASATARLYGFARMDTPIFEFSEVFHRAVGDTSDIVTKETYTFTDRGGESITLRPEFTAAIVRSFISNGLQQNLPFKAFYAGPAFRYERPQKGRLRQFHQIGAELLGAAEPMADVELIALGMQTLSVLGLFPSPQRGEAGRGAEQAQCELSTSSVSARNAPTPTLPLWGRECLTLEINSLGDAESRSNYRDALVQYLSQHEAKLSDDSKMRLAKNPLRILDSKDAGDREIIAGAPTLHAYFNEASTMHFAKVKAGLDTLGIAYKVSEKLVRGLDYYSHTVFEITTDKLGAQGTVLAGGRYDGLVKLMGGQDVAGIGFAAGVERLVALMEGQPNAIEKPVATIIPMSEVAEIEGWKLVQMLRLEGVAVDIAYKGNAKKRFERANKVGAPFAVILGDDELASGQLTLKNLETGVQEKLSREQVMEKLKAYVV